MIRAGYVKDNKNAACLQKISEDGQYCCSAMLVGFGTQPMAGAICDDAVQRIVGFVAYYLQKTFELLLSKAMDTEQASGLLLHQLTKFNENISYVSRHIGQGLYVTGCICYVAQEQFICLPFGGAHAYLWDNKEILPLAEMPEENGYILNALGGAALFNTVIAKGNLPVGHQLLCMTQQPPENLLEGIMSELIRTNQVVVPTTVYRGLERKELPLAVINIAQAANLRGG